MKKKLFIIVIFLLLFLPKNIYSQDEATLTKEIDELTQKVADLQKQGKTLSSQIAYMDNQTKLTILKIKQTETQINDLSVKIGRLEVSLDQMVVVLKKRITAAYKQGNPDALSLFFTSQKFADFLNRYKYLRVIQGNDKKILYSMETTKTNYDDQKLQVENLKKTLESQQKLLAQQKKDKQNLLVVTQNDEKKYQQLLAQAYAEKAAIEQALVAGTKVGPIKKGDPIALVGNSGYPGCSTGKHLHFEIRKNNAWTDPSAYLQNKSVENDQGGGGNVNVGSGSWSWPIDDPIRITQFYGNTPYSQIYKYSGGIHTGIDMVPSSSDVIRAPSDGILYRSSQKCGSSVINIAYIEHGDNLVSFYLHVQ